MVSAAEPFYIDTTKIPVIVSLSFVKSPTRKEGYVVDTFRDELLDTHISQIELRRTGDVLILQGMCHVAPRGFYRSVQETMERCAAAGYYTLFEGVRGGDTDEDDMSREELLIHRFFLGLINLYPSIAERLGLSEQRRHISYDPERSKNADISWREFVRQLHEVGFRPPWFLAIILIKAGDLPFSADEVVLQKTPSLFTWLARHSRFFRDTLSDCQNVCAGFLEGLEEVFKDIDLKKKLTENEAAIHENETSGRIKKFVLKVFFSSWLRKARRVSLGYRNEVAVFKVEAYFTQAASPAQALVHYGEGHIKGLLRLLAKNGWKIHRRTQTALRDFVGDEGADVLQDDTSS